MKRIFIYTFLTMILALGMSITARADGEKVQVCHNGNVIEVSINALPAHLAHGDVVWPPPEPECPAGEECCWELDPASCGWVEVVCPCGIPDGEYETEDRKWDCQNCEWTNRPEAREGQHSEWNPVRCEWWWWWGVPNQ